MLVGDLIRGRDERYHEIDVSDWDEVGPEEGGKKPKRWIANPADDRRWLMKEATFSRPPNRPAYRKGDDWAERIACAVADVLRIPAAKVELAVSSRSGRETYGVICLSMLRDHGERLVHGDALLAEQGVLVTPTIRNQYTLDAIRQALVGVGPPTPAFSGLSWDVFVGYLVLDALIGNTDRHEENWGIIESADTRRLAPSFDHASSLGFQLNDDDKQQRLESKDRNRVPETWAEWARAPFAGRPKTHELLVRSQQLGDGREVDRWLGSVEDVDDLVEPVWTVPEHRMSTVSRRFAERVIRHNWSRLTG